MKIEIEKREIVPGKEELSCEAWSVEGKWAGQPKPNFSTVFYKKQPNWRFYFPTSTEETPQQSFFYNCDDIGRVPGKPTCFFIDDYIYTSGFILE